MAGYEPETEKKKADEEGEAPGPAGEPAAGETRHVAVQPGEGGQQAAAGETRGYDPGVFAGDEPDEPVGPEAADTGESKALALLGRTYEAKPYHGLTGYAGASGAVGIQVGGDRRVTVTFTIRKDLYDGYSEWPGSAHGTVEVADDRITFTSRGRGTFTSHTTSPVTGEPVETTRAVDYEPGGTIYPGGMGSGGIGFMWEWVLEGTRP